MEEVPRPREVHRDARGGGVRTLRPLGAGPLGDLLLADPAISDALRTAAEDVIGGTPEELRYFLEVGRYEVDG